MWSGVFGEGRAIRRQSFPGVKTAAAWLCMAVLAGVITACQAAAPDQGTAPDVVRRALREGEVVVYGNTDVAGPVVAGFERRFPRVKVRYHELTATAIQKAIIAEAAAGRPVADLAWSSSMDIQVKLVNDGYAQAYRSPGAARLPRWAVWRDAGFGITAEPIGFAYNRRLLAPADVPRSHADLASGDPREPGALARQDRDVRPRRERRRIHVHVRRHPGLSRRLDPDG